MNVPKFIPLLLISAVIAACGGDDPEKLMASAKEYIAKNDHKAAVIQIKNFLLKKPDSPEARFMLGTSLLHSGDPSAAEIELAKARELKFPDDQVVPPLARSLAMQGKFRKITEELGKVELTTPSAKADFQIVLSNAYAAQGQLEQSKVALGKALAAEPANVNALITQARQKIDSADYTSAQVLVDELVSKSPQNPEVWKLKGDYLIFAKTDLDGALTAFKKTLELKPDFLAGYTGIINILLQQGKLDAAKTEIEAMKKVAPNNLQTKYFEAQYAYQNKDFKTSRDLALQLLKGSPDNVKALQLAGAVEFQLGSLLQAEIYLNKVVQSTPQSISARRLLAMTYLRTGQAEKALATLTPAMAQINNDAGMLSLAGEVYLQNGDVKRAEEAFAKASKLNPADARSRTSLALTHLIGGDPNSAFSELETIASSDAGVTADLALISANLRRKDYDKALKAIDGLEKKQPNMPLAANLRGKTQLVMKDPVAARKSFEAALKLSPTYFPAVSSLAALDLADKKPDDAKARFERVLSVEPKNGQALLALAELRARGGGAKDEVAGLITNAINANPADMPPRLLLVDYLLRNGDYKQAASAAQSALTALPDKPEILDALGRAQLASGEVNQAISTFNKVAALQPQSPVPQLRLAEAYMADKNKESARQALNKAVAIKPDYIEAQRALIIMDAGAESTQTAVTTARTIQRQRPKETIGYMLEGDTYVSARKWNEALAAYQNGLKQTGAVEAALKVHGAMLGGGHAADAEKFAAAWLKEHPKDVVFPFYLGDAALSRKDYAMAEKMYANVVQVQPLNAAAYNNLAWVTGQLKKDKAVTYAEKANTLMPNQPAFIDTLAMLLLDQNDAAKALDWQKKAVALQPANPLFQLNLAKIYVKSGDKGQAKPILTDLAKLGDKFPAQTEVGEMLKSL
jgi:putative PEP-CTERM system TPR-repeat lipoprotein